MTRETFTDMVFLAIGVSMSGLGLFLIAWSVRDLIRTLKLVLYGAKTIGKVVGTIEEKGADGDQFFHSVIEYQTYTGEVLNRKSDVGRGEPEKINDQIEVFYDINKPENMLENTFFAKYGLSLMLLFGASVCIFLGVKGIESYISGVTHFRSCPF